MKRTSIVFRKGGRKKLQEFFKIHGNLKEVKAMNRKIALIVATIFYLVAGLAQADTFLASNGGKIVATQAGEGMMVLTTTIPGVVTADLYPGGRQALPVTVPHGQRLQLMDGQGRWLCISPASEGTGGFCGATLTLSGVKHSCPKAHTDCVVKVE